MNHLTRKTRIRRGQTLIELIGASTIIAIALVPALKLMRDSIRINQEAETSNLLATLAVSKLEEFLVSTASNWSDADVAGDFSSEGYAAVRFTLERTDLVADGGIPDDLMCITSTVWEDQNGDSSWTSGEPRVVFASKLAQSLAYNLEANGS